MARFSNTVSVSKDLIGQISDLSSPDLSSQIDSLRNPESALDTLTKQKSALRAFADELRKYDYGHVGTELLQLFKTIGELAKKG